MFVLPILTWVLSTWISGVFAENHLIESMQALLLIGAAAAHWKWACSHSAEEAVGVSYHRILGVLLLSLFAREMDIDKLGSSLWWESVELLFRLGILCLWLAIGVGLLKRARLLWEARWTIVGHSGSYWVYAGILLYASTWFLDKQLLPLSAEVSLYFEETLQLQATALFLVGAIGYPLRR